LQKYRFFRYKTTHIRCQFELTLVVTTNNVDHMNASIVLLIFMDMSSYNFD